MTRHLEQHGGATDIGGPLRLFQPEPEDFAGEISQRMRLSEFYYQFVEPVHLAARDARAGYLEVLRTSVEYWVRFTGDPPLAAIDQYACADFVRRLKELPGRRTAIISPNTVRKHCRAVQSVLDLAGPSDRRARRNQNLLLKVPYIERPPPEEKPAEDAFTRREIELLLAATSRATRPHRLPVSAEVYWRSLYQVLLATGLRIGSLMRLEWSFLELAEADDARLVIPARSIGKGRRGHTVPLTPWAKDAIMRLEGCDAVRIFSWPRRWPQSKSNLHDVHRDQIASCLPAHRRFGFHGFRKAHNMELAHINPLACQKSLGHSSGRTTVEHYTSRKIVRDAVNQIEPPKWRRERQLELF